MGRGNVCVFNDYEGLYYIDNDYLDAYYRDDDEEDCREMAMLGDLDSQDLRSGEWRYDEVESYWIWESTESQLKSEMKRRFESFSDCDCRTDRDCRAILENRLFYIAVQDNQWSMAVMLIQKDDCYCDLSGLQKKHYMNYLEGLKEVLFEMFPKLGTYAGPWTHGTIIRPETK